MKNRARALTLLAAMMAVPVLGQYEGSISTVYSPLAADFQVDCQGLHAPMYAPALYLYPDGSLGMITHGNCLGHCDFGTGDSLFRWKRSPGGSWSSIYGGLSPSASDQTLDGQTIPAGGLNPFKQTFQATPPPAGDICATTTQYTTYEGAYGYPATIVLNNKVYMAFLKGNSDAWNGEVWWAVSSDWGYTWSVYSAPIFYGFYHRGHAANGSCPEGFAGISMTTTLDNNGVTWIHIYGSYHHPERERGAWDAATSAIHYRFPYNPGHPFGFNSPVELYYNGTFIPHSGKLVWNYDAGVAYGSDQKLNTNLAAAPWSPPGYFFTYSVTKNPSTGVYYMNVDKWRSDTDPLYYVTSCDAIHWSGVKEIDTTAVRNLYPGKYLVNNAYWYGTLSGQTGMWGLLSLGNFCGGVGGEGVYDGTRILPVKISFNETVTCP